jgi:hypothetical protein
MFVLWACSAMAGVWDEDSAPALPTTAYISITLIKDQTIEIRNKRTGQLIFEYLPQDKVVWSEFRDILIENHYFLEEEESESWHHMPQP